MSANLPLPQAQLQAHRDLEAQGGQQIQRPGSPVLPRTAVHSVHYYKSNPRDRTLILESGVILGYESVTGEKEVSKRADEHRAWKEK